MAFRTFASAGGRIWNVWNVVPHAVDRRSGAERRDEEEALDGRRDGEEPRANEDRRQDPLRAGEPDRRSGIDRRSEAVRRGDLDRRSGEDRREELRTRAQLPGQYAHGWLCFESEGEKRRLAPLPVDWETMSETTLTSLLEEAVRVPDRPHRRIVIGQPDAGGPS
jgi:hypothetical protein